MTFRSVQPMISIKKTGFINWIVETLLVAPLDTLALNTILDHLKSFFSQTHPAAEAITWNTNRV